MKVAVALFLPRAVAHPMKKGEESAGDLVGSLRDHAASLADDLPGRTRGPWKKVKRAIA